MTIGKEEIRHARATASDILAGLAAEQYRRKKMRGLLSSDASCMRDSNSEKSISIKTAAVMQKNVHDAKVSIQATAKVRDAYLGFLKSNYVSIVNYINDHHADESKEFFVALYTTLNLTIGAFGGLYVIKKINSKNAAVVYLSAHAKFVVAYGYVKIP